jgi:hypothetical protein
MALLSHAGSVAFVSAERLLLEALREQLLATLNVREEL